MCVFVFIIKSTYDTLPLNIDFVIMFRRHATIY